MHAGKLGIALRTISRYPQVDTLSLRYKSVKFGPQTSRLCLGACGAVVHAGALGAALKTISGIALEPQTQQHLSGVKMASSPDPSSPCKRDFFDSDVEQMWRTRDSQGQTLALAFR